MGFYKEPKNEKLKNKKNYYKQGTNMKKRKIKVSKKKLVGKKRLPMSRHAKRLIKKKMEKVLTRKFLKKQSIKKRIKKFIPQHITPKKVIDVIEQEEKEALTKFLESSSVREILINLGGENALAIVRGFENPMTDEDLSKKLNIRISDVRYVLNRLHNAGLVEYRREKDGKTGWYHYKWIVHRKKIIKWVDNAYNQKINPSFDPEKEYYSCNNCGSETIFEFSHAYEFGFKCPICGDGLEYVEKKENRETPGTQCLYGG